MPGVDGAFGSATPTAKIATRARYSPSDVSRTNRSPSGPSSRRVAVHGQSYRIRVPVRSTKVARLRSISGRDGKYELPSIRPGMSDRFSGSSASRLFQS